MILHSWTGHTSPPQNLVLSVVNIQTNHLFWANWANRICVTASHVNSQHLEDESEAAQNPVCLRRQLDGQSVDRWADQQTVDEVGLAVTPFWPGFPLGVGRVVIPLQLHQDLAGVDDGGRRGEGQGGCWGGDGDGRGSGVGWDGLRSLRRTGGGGQWQDGGRGRRWRFWAQQT